MLKIILNDTIEFPINGYNRYTSIQENGQNANCNINFNDAEGCAQLEALGKTPITDIKIFSDETQIYHRANQNARLANISENVYDGGISISASIVFGNSEEE